jgi:excinuclease ABC subunit C
MVESLLDDVAGLGEVRRKAVIKHFGSLKALRAASVEDVAEVSGIGPATASAIVEALRRDQATRSVTGVNTTTGEIEEG